MSTPLTTLNPYWILAKVGIAVAVVGGAFFYGHHLGYSGEKSAYDLYVAQQKSAAEQQVAANKSALAFQQAQYSLQINKLQQDHSDEVANLTTQRDTALADSSKYSGQLRQYLSGSHRVAAVVPVASGSAAGTDSAGQGGLLDGVSSLNWYLTQRFHDADVNAATLNEAIAVIAKDREICNGSLPGVTAK